MAEIREGGCASENRSWKERVSCPLRFGGACSGLTPTRPEQSGGDPWLIRSFVVRSKFKSRREGRPFSREFCEHELCVYGCARGGPCSFRDIATPRGRPGCCSGDAGHLPTSGCCSAGPPGWAHIPGWFSCREEVPGCGRRCPRLCGLCCPGRSTGCPA